jgi:hypothetical protein
MPKKNSEVVDIECVVRIDKEKSIGIADGTVEKKGKWAGREKLFWLPKSLVEINDDGTVTMPRWLAEQEGLV